MKVGLIGRLLASLDLRFSDPKVESSYHVYYAQVKWDLLPTAIMVMLLVNILQSLITALFFILPTPVMSSSSSLSSPLASNRFYAILIVPAILQFIVLIATCTFLKIARAESRHSYRRHSRQRLSNTTTKIPLTRTSSSASSSSSSSSASATDYSDQDNEDDEEDQEAKNEAIALKKRSSVADLEAAPKKFWPSLTKSSACNRRLSLPYILWACQLLQLASGLWPLQSFISYSTLLLYSYTVYVIFPIRLMNCILLALGLSLSQPAIDYLLQLNFQPTNMTPMTSHFSKLCAFMLLTLGINIIGMMSFFFYERQQRAAFLETRQSMETKLTLEQESREQERLLLSILPKHLAAEIRKDLGAVVGGQFKKIYMRRHNNVSILFADIVGFTAISSNCPAPELVRILNELFARFDKLAEKYHQLRIKILGDCYYAISGAPDERPDHAVLCVHMGLSMVEAIKSVREKTKSTVDMRVGVHTGGVLAGVLGQRQWQFDVYSKDVELANKMESSGLPGRVHISDATLRFLNDEFEVSDGNGATREEALRRANIQTYFIDRVKKPYPEGTLDANKEQQRPSEGSSKAAAEAASASQRKERHKNAKEIAAGGGARGTKVSQAGQALKTSSGSTDPPKGAKERNDSFNVETQIKRFSLHFSNSRYERQFRSTSDIASCISLIGLPITLLCAALAHLYLYKQQTEVTVVYGTHFLAMLIVVVVCLAPYLIWKRRTSAASRDHVIGIQRQSPQHQYELNQNHLNHLEQPQNQRRLAGRIMGVAGAVKQSAPMKLALTIFMTLVWLLAHAIGAKQTSSKLSLLTDSKTIQLFTVDLFNYFAITCSLAITAVTRVSFLVKTILIFAVILLQVILNLTLLSDILQARLMTSSHLYELALGGHKQQSQQDRNHSTHLKFTASSDDIFARYSQDYNFDQYIFTLTLVTICWALFLINRQFERTNRRLFLWRKQVEQRKEKVADMRQKNEALVYNILPPNVAKIFLGKRTINDEELYSKSYEAVGVLFAAMPNFSDFYSEESVNNQGLECLRFLNEVISDYDALLDQDRFKNIIKIKTMGSTYMAASGLYEGDAIEEAANSREQLIDSKAMIERISSDIDKSPLQQGHDNKSPNGGDSNNNMSKEQQEAQAVHSKWGHLEQLTEFALALKETLNNINEQSFNNFVLRIGINHGPITAGVIGVKKPHFDMWGNTVNVASRMESTGRAGSIQVVEETAIILRHFGFEFDQRGLVSVKGKGKLMTYYLTGRSRKNVPQPASASPSSSGNIGAPSTVAVSSNSRPGSVGSGGTHTKPPTAVQTSGTPISPQANCVTAAPDSSSKKSFIQDLRSTSKQSTSISIV